MNWQKIRIIEETDRSTSPIQHIVRYEEGPYAPGTARASVIPRHGEQGMTTVEGPHLPQAQIDYGYGPRGGPLRRGLTGELGGEALTISRPRFGPLPSQRAIHIDVGKRRWSLVSAGFNQVELRRDGPQGQAIFRWHEMIDEITSREVAIVLLLEGLNSPAEKVKILAQIVANL